MRVSKPFVLLAAPALVLACVAQASAQEPRRWIAEVTVGWAGFIDDATKNYLVMGATVRRYVTPRLSIGPEIVLMRNSSVVTDRIVMATGNLAWDIGDRSQPVRPFLVAGGGIFASRDRVVAGPFWSSDPAFTAGGGVRARVAETLSAAAEYRFGWEGHHRVTGSLGLHW